MSHRPVQVRTIVDERAYRCALAGASIPDHQGDVRALEAFARQWEQEPPSGLKASDLCSLAWYYSDPIAFEVWSRLAPPSVHLLLVMAEEASANAKMFNVWSQISKGLMQSSLRPWQQCMAHAAIDAYCPTAALGLLSNLDLDGPMPARAADIVHWLWQDDPGMDEPKLDFTRPLHHALELGVFEVAQWLLDHGACVWKHDMENRNALDVVEDKIRKQKEWLLMQNAGEVPTVWHRWHARLQAMMEGEVLELGTSQSTDKTSPPHRL